MRILLAGTQSLQFRRKLVAAGHAVDVAKDRIEADQRVRSDSVDVVVLDLPGMADGLVCLQEWRRCGVTGFVLVLTACGADTVSALDLGADAAVTKPCPVVELLARLRAMLRLVRDITEPIVRVFDLEIAISARRVKRAGKNIYLSPREFRLLQFLVSHQGKVVTRAMILQSMNSTFTEIRSNLVAVYIHSLRRKIDKGFAVPLIHTVRGKGYQFRCAGKDERERATHTSGPSASAYTPSFRHAPARHELEGAAPRRQTADSSCPGPSGIA